MAEEPKVETTPTPSDYELTYDLAPLEGLTVEAARREILKTEADPNHPFWLDHRFHSAAVQRQLAVHKIIHPEHVPAPGEISRKMSLEAAGVTKEELEKMPDAQDLLQHEEIDDITGQLKKEWGEEKYDQNFNLMQKVVKEFTSEEQRAFLDRSDPELRPLGNSKEFLLLVHRLGEMIEQQEGKFKEIDERRAIQARFKKAGK
jgi:hypothetical protein